MLQQLEDYARIKDENIKGRAVTEVGEFAYSHLFIVQCNSKLVQLLHRQWQREFTLKCTEKKAAETGLISHRWWKLAGISGVVPSIFPN